MGYAYQILEDSFFGKLIGDVLCAEGIPKQLILDSIHSNLIGSRQFTGTPKAEKQIIIAVLPDKFRKWISERKFQQVKTEFAHLAFGVGDKSPKIDLALEILEWIFSGFDEDDLVLELIKILVGKKVQINQNIVVKLRGAYQKTNTEAI